MHAGSQCADALRVGIALSPDFDGPAHPADISKQSKQHDDAVDVGRITPAREEALTGGLHVNRISLQGETRLLIAERESDGDQVLLEVPFRMRDGVLRQVVCGVLLSLRIQPFAADPSTNG